MNGSKKRKKTDQKEKFKLTSTSALSDASGYDIKTTGDAAAIPSD